MAFRFEASLLTMQQDESLSKRAHDAPETHYITSHARLGFGTYPSIMESQIREKSCMDGKQDNNINA
ncbi:hypothetical protein TanjilG_07560 [Lupinus angustifolius]|uniref:Uncharacterized protein n=1 Tax=Lupinus angustifolius TaxID=3871 RepID=A0A1J7GWQ2_LUPAN|nr:hypothetical protein TanjilG_07560 [Lupinus angustifolius]